MHETHEFSFLFHIFYYTLSLSGHVCAIIIHRPLLLFLIQHLVQPARTPLHALIGLARLVLDTLNLRALGRELVVHGAAHHLDAREPGRDLVEVGVDLGLHVVALHALRRRVELLAAAAVTAAAAGAGSAELAVALRVPVLTALRHLARRFAFALQGRLFLFGLFLCAKL